MPHFVIECSANVLTSVPEETVIEQVHLTANASGLFDEGDIKVRIRPYETYRVGNSQEAFIHVFGDIMEGRSTGQKADLSKQIVKTLLSLFPEVPNIAINIREFEKATYCNRRMLEDAL